MDVFEKAYDFASKRPSAIGVFCYGSAVFKQDSYLPSDKPQIDMLFIVDDMKKWHMENMALNSKDYPLTGRAYVNLAPIERLKGHNKVTYLSHIKEAGSMFKFGVKEINDFVEELQTWSTFFMAGRFQKPVLPIKTTDELDYVINKDREAAFLIATLFCDEITTRKEILMKLCSLSYVGTLRMQIAENPRKVENIVNGNYRDLVRVYRKYRDYIYIAEDDSVLIDRQKQLSHINSLPKFLLEYLHRENVDFNDINSIRTGIINFLLERNKKEECLQILEGFATNGLYRSTLYIKKKLEKKFTK